MKKRAMLSLLLAAALLSGCGTTAAVPQQTEPETAVQEPEPEAEIQYDTTGQYRLVNGEAAITDIVPADVEASSGNKRVFYEIFVGSFSDSNGDGTGDLQGILNRLDYLNDGDPSSGLSLGVEGIWLTPIFPSDSYHKYDVKDYYSIDPDFGTLEDFQSLLAACHERDIKVIIDLPINHTAYDHPMFQSFRRAHLNGDTEDPAYDYYNWYTEGSEKPNGSTYRVLTGTKDYYEANFDAGMPELNYDNPAVYAEMLAVAEFWLELGVDGFRFDAAKYIYYGDNGASAAFWERYTGDLKSEYPELFTVYEVWDSDAVTYPYNTSGSCFNFSVSGAEGLLASTAKKGDVNIYTNYVEKYLARIAEESPDAVYCPFLSNHDMDRISGSLTVAGRQAFMAANLLLLGPGAPFIYYGEEIGMKGSRGSADTDANRRLAMLWGDEDTVADPVGTTYDAAKQTNGTVTWSLPRGDSLYNHYKKLILIRKANPEIANGEVQALNFGGVKLGGFLFTWQGSTVAVIHNTASVPVTVDLSDATDYLFTELNAAIGDGSAALEGTSLTLDANTSAVLR